MACKASVNLHAVSQGLASTATPCCQGNIPEGRKPQATSLVSPQVFSHSLPCCCTEHCGICTMNVTRIWQASLSHVCHQRGIESTLNLNNPTGNQERVNNGVYFQSLLQLQHCITVDAPPTMQLKASNLKLVNLLLPEAHMLTQSKCQKARQ